MSLDYLIKNEKSLTVNLGSEKGFSVTEVLEMARKVTGKPIPAKTVKRREGDPAKLSASCSLALDLLGWKAGHSDLKTLISTSWMAYNK